MFCQVYALKNVRRHKKLGVPPASGTFCAEYQGFGFRWKKPNAVLKSETWQNTVINLVFLLFGVFLFLGVGFGGGVGSRLDLLVGVVLVVYVLWRRIISVVVLVLDIISAAVVFHFIKHSIGYA